MSPLIQKVKDAASVMTGIAITATLIGTGGYLGRDDILEFWKHPGEELLTMIGGILITVAGVMMLIGLFHLIEWLKAKKALYLLSSNVQKGQPTCGACAKISTKECALRRGFMGKMHPACGQFDLSPKIPRIGAFRGFIYINALRVLGIIITVVAIIIGASVLTK